jgi:ectoine hydroxylase-related dioxygenase (phytanoyl-CoA dioxygenase family)
MASTSTQSSFRIPVANTEIGKQFGEDGYYLAKGVFSGDEVAALEQDFDRIVDQLVQSGEEINARWSGPEMERLESQKMVVIHTHNVQQFSGKWSQALFQPRFLKVATDILGPDLMLHHTKLFQKPSESGAPFPMHQDWTYFPTVRDSMMAAIIHVSKATDEMGCLRVYPGSHKYGRVSGSSGQIDSDLLKEHPIEGATVLEAEPGDVLFFHYFTIHGSMPNRSRAVRKTVLVQMHSGDDHVEEGNLHPDERLVLSGWNHFATRNKAGERK